MSEGTAPVEIDGGISLATFDLRPLTDDIARMHAPGTSKRQAEKLRKRVTRLSGSHYLALVAQSLLEQFSTEHLGRTLAGFSRDVEGELVVLRRRLPPEQQQEAAIVHAFERVCRAVRGAGYGDDDAAASQDYFATTLPSLLDAIAEWAQARSHHALSAAIADTRERYAALLPELEE